ncbi:MAG: hypothetical protein H7Y32_00675, partial [Chloroflexales bacterium]|nr:hypothetical protein [Chloroflexales bacterium]
AGQVYSLHLAGGSLYAGGSFDAAGAVANTNSLAAWDGAQWRSLRSDLLFSDPQEDYINAVALLPDGKIFVAGDFNDSGRPLVSNIAFWDGARWRGTGLGLEDGSTAFLGGDGYAVAVNDAGQVFVGGDFEELGGLPFSRIAMWDGSAWQDLGGGVDGDVSALLIRGDELYVAGGFSTVGNGITAVRVAKWNMRTKTWSAVGNGPPGGYVHALAFVGDTLYAGGGDFPSNVECCLWKFNGAEWAPFSQRYRSEFFAGPFGSESTVLALASDGQRLFVGGAFLDIEQRNPLQRFETNELFVYNPADDSVALFGAGADNGTVPARVRAITIANDGIYVGGQFTSIASTAALNIARLSGGGWSALGTGVLGEDVVVGAIAANGADIYVGGSFETAGVQAFNIARWNAQSRSWSALGCGIARNGETVSIERVASLAVQPQGLPNAGLYVAGGILEAGCKPSVGFAIYRDVGARQAPQTGRALVPLVRK